MSQFEEYEISDDVEDGLDIFRDLVADKVAIGVASIHPVRFHGQRFLSWEIVDGGLLRLKEVWLKKNLIDSEVCIKIELDEDAAEPGGKMVLASFLDSNSEEEVGVVITLCLAFKSGQMHRIQLSSANENESVLANLVDVDIRQGKLD